VTIYSSSQQLPASAITNVFGKFESFSVRFAIENCLISNIKKKNRRGKKRIDGRKKQDKVSKTTVFN